MGTQASRVETVPWPTVADEDLFWCLETAEARLNRAAHESSDSDQDGPWPIYYDMEIAALDGLCRRLRIALFERGLLATPFGHPWPRKDPEARGHSEQW